MAKKVTIGEPLPDIEVQATGGERFRLPTLTGRRVVLYFYPKDNTPGCTLEGKDFRDHYAAFKKLKTVVYGISRDRLAAHEKFKAKYEFPFELIADEDEKLCKAFGVINEKSLYGRIFLGLTRSTFVFDDKGILRKEYRGVKVSGHVPEVLEEIKKL